MQEPSIFTKVLNGDIPGEVIYQDDSSFVMLTIDPLTLGHALVIPKVEIDHIWDLPDDVYHHLYDVAKMIAAKLRTSHGYKRIGTIVEGFGVPHAHIHVFGLNEGIDPTIIRHAATHQHATPEELKAEADILRAA